MDDVRWERIETKVAYLEREVAELNGIVTEQSKEAVILQNQVDKLERKLQELMEDEGDERENRRPPHY